MVLDSQLRRREAGCSTHPRDIEGGRDVCREEFWTLDVGRGDVSGVPGMTGSYYALAGHAIISERPPPDQ